jgi:hypothetical protein
MAYRRNNYRRSRRSKVTMGKTFRTKKGKVGRYKYVNGTKVAFVRKGRRY